MRSDLSRGHRPVQRRAVSVFRPFFFLQGRAGACATSRARGVGWLAGARADAEHASFAVTDRHSQIALRRCTESELRELRECTFVNPAP